MCGVVGLVNFDCSPVPNQLIELMTNALAHRGPDGSGVELFGEVGIGHRRLIIIDPEGGRQPMSNEDGQVWVTFNGEIYNYRELRSELQAKAHVFRTKSDTETIVHAYEEWGEQCVEHFRGMFAFGIVDLRERRVFLARDQLGIKPLYYGQFPNSFAFASELQALRCMPGLQLHLDLQAIDQYLWLQYIPAPRTAFQGVYKLPPAHRMSVSFDGKVIGPEEYWKLEFRPNYHRSEAEWLEAIDDVLRDSVRAHLVSDVPFGAFLSGGVDSSAIVAYMSQILQEPVRTFTIGFEEEDFSEIDYAKKAAQRWGTEHHVEIVKPDAMGILPRLVKHYGEPFGDSSALPTFYVSQMARRFVPMVLSGDGGDESFAGYDSYRAWMAWLCNEDRPSRKHLLFSLMQTLTLRHRSLLNPSLLKPRLISLLQAITAKPCSTREPTLSNWLRFINYINSAERKSLWRKEYRTLCDMPLDTFEREFARTQGFPPCSTVQYMDLKTYLPYDILTKVDVASMMHGLEVRTPLVDIRVVEFAATIPESVSISKEYTGKREGKLLLKRAMEKYYPSDFLKRPKMGFAVPISKWFAPNGALRDALHDRLLGLDSPLREFFEPETMASLVERNATGPLWLLLFLAEWLRQNRSSVSL